MTYLCFVIVLILNINDMSEEITIEQQKTEMMVNAGLNWKVNTEGVMTSSGILIPDRIALVREDTKKVLGIHTEAYVPYQNDELLDLLYRISKESGLIVHTGGSFKGGEKVWFQLKSNDYKIGYDTIQSFISGFNSFDGRTSLAFGNASITVSCQNTFWRGYRQVETRLRHSSTMKPRIEEILRKIDSLMVEERDGIHEIERMGNYILTSEVREMITKFVFGLEKEEKLDTVSTNKTHKLERFNLAVDNEINGKGQNLWGLFSGITRYTTHDMKKGDNSESKMFGRTGAIEREAYKTLVEMV